MGEKEKKLEKEVRYYFPHNFVLGFEWNEWSGSGFGCFIVKFLVKVNTFLAIIDSSNYMQSNFMLLCNYVGFLDVGVLLR